MKKFIVFIFNTYKQVFTSDFFSDNENERMIQKTFWHDLCLLGLFLFNVIFGIILANCKIPNKLFSWNTFSTLLLILTSILLFGCGQGKIFDDKQKILKEFDITKEVSDKYSQSFNFFLDGVMAIGAFINCFIGDFFNVATWLAWLKIESIIINYTLKNTFEDCKIEKKQTK